MASSSEGLGVPFCPPAVEEEDQLEIDVGVGGSSPSGSAPSNDRVSTAQGGGSVAQDVRGVRDADARVKTTRTSRTVKKRKIFEPESQQDKEKKKKKRGRPKGSGKVGRPKKGARPALHHLLEDEENGSGSGNEDRGGDGGEGASADGHRKRSRNASDGENRWDRIREKFKLLLHKMRKDMHFLQVYQQDGWKSSGREKLKPQAELQKAKERIGGVKAELREVAKRLTEMNSDGARWLGLEPDADGNIQLGEVLCTKCGRGDTDDSDDILLCDYAGCFRAYHQNCLTPAIKPDAFPDAEEDWFCWQCECLLDCLELLEHEFQGHKFRSWADVFPDVEFGKGEGLGDEDAQLDDSDDSDDDESFKASSSESEDENVHRADNSSIEEDALPGAESGERSDEGSSRKRENCRNRDDHEEEEEEDDDDDESDDDKFNFMSDAESVDSDELEKLQMEAGDLAECGSGTEQANTEEVTSGRGGGDRVSRARIRRQRRAAQLGLTVDGTTLSRAEERRTLDAALAGDGTLDTANILNSRRNRKKVDYVKLNDALFGNEYREELDGDKVVSSEEDEHSDSSTASTSSLKKIKKNKKSKHPKQHTTRQSKTPTIDPFTGLPRKRGRPRKYPEGAAAVPVATVAMATPQKRKRGRPRKQPVVSPVEPAVGKEEMVVDEKKVDVSGAQVVASEAQVVASEAQVVAGEAQVVASEAEVVGREKERGPVVEIGSSGAEANGDIHIKGRESPPSPLTVSNGASCSPAPGSSGTTASANRSSPKVPWPSNPARSPAVERQGDVDVEYTGAASGARKADSLNGSTSRFRPACTEASPRAASSMATDEVNATRVWQKSDSDE